MSYSNLGRFAINSLCTCRRVKYMRLRQVSIENQTLSSHEKRHYSIRNKQVECPLSNRVSLPPDGSLYYSSSSLHDEGVHALLFALCKQILDRNRLTLGNAKNRKDKYKL